MNDMIPNQIPDYYGLSPNYANSPLPTGYPIIIIAGGGGSGATAYASISNGSIEKITVNSAGNGYTSTPDVIIQSDVGTGAKAQANVVNGYVQSIMVLSSGSGYTITEGMRKFVDSLPGVGKENANNLGQYMPVAIPDINTYPGYDYYEIELGEYTEQMHSDIPATKLRGYRQINTTDTSVNAFHYMGPLIKTQQNRPVRVKFINNLPIGSGGDLFLPVDTTVMGAGMGPLGMDVPPGEENYTQNRATIHLHGGITPWISDGTMHQWITPANEKTPYPVGVAARNVPDMPDPGPGALTFYYTNQNSNRFMFYHDHSYGITRLNFYGGESGDYILEDSVEQSMIKNNILPSDQIFLNIQDKTYVPKESQLMAEDPLWDTAKWGGEGSLWYPHIYMTNQNPYSIDGAYMLGRWDYGPWFWPPTFPTYGVQPNPYYDPVNAPWEPPYVPGYPDISYVPESFMDTPVINGCAYPYLEVGQKAYRFRILNASTERYYNLQLYYAGSNDSMWNADGTLNNGDAGDVPMVPAAPNTGLPDRWPTDGRDGGVPNPANIGPTFIQIGNEGGFLPGVAELPNTPIGYVYNRRDITVLNVANKTLFLGPAERADVIVDFSQVPDGSNVILYNDSPAPVPGFDVRYDYYTGDPDNTDTGGAPTTQPGYGPNTRTLLQFRVSSAHGKSDPYNVDALKEALPIAYGKTQPPPIVPNAAYNIACNQQGPEDSYVRIQDTTISFFNGPILGLELINGGTDYTSAPTVEFIGGGSGAVAEAQINGVMQVTVTNSGSGYITPPNVYFVGGGGAGAEALATLTGIVSAISINNSGIGYTSAPTVTIQGGGGSGATAIANIFMGRISSITVTSAGQGYTTSPTIIINGGGGVGATATASITQVLDKITVINGGHGYITPPDIVLSGGLGSGATAVSTIGVGQVTGLVLLNGGNYTGEPTIQFIGGGGTGASAKAIGWTFPLIAKSIIEEFDPNYGRMNAQLGVEIPNTLLVGQVSIPYSDIDPPTELFKIKADATDAITPEGVQIWKVTHNGVDTHAMHWHLFNVQLINRVGWDGAIRPPDLNELGWKDTVRMNPLEDCIVAIRPIPPDIPFELTNSVRPLDVTMPIGSTTGFMNVDPNNEPAPVTNKLTNFGWEHMWHCHLLGHEENDMMRTEIFVESPKAPSNLIAIKESNVIILSWIDQSVNETGWIVERALNIDGPWAEIDQFASTTGDQTGGIISYTDITVQSGITYYYRIKAINTIGYVEVYPPPATGYPNMSQYSESSNIVNIMA